MERNVAELREQVALLERRIEKFKERVAHARWQTAMLVRAKAPHPRYPFWEWEHRTFIDGTTRQNVSRVVDHLFLRLKGQWEFDTSCKDIPGIVSAELYQPRPPTREEVFAFIKTAAGFTSNAQVLEMFAVMRLNGYRLPLIEFMLRE
jgi:hypothetical protein